MESLKLNGTVYLVADAAREFGKDPSHIRRVCIDKKIGRLISNHVRLLTKSDMAELRKYFRKVGRKSKNSD